MKGLSVTRSFVVLILVLSWLSVRGQSQTNVVTWHNDNWRTGENIHETALNPTNINSPSTFGKICTATTDGQIYAQPLVVSNVTINQLQYSRVVYVVTQNDSVYAFYGGSNGPTCTQLLQTNLLPAGEQPVSCGAIGDKQCGSIAPVVGILGTPVIDASTNTMYVVTESQVGNPPTSFVHRLHALDIRTLSTAQEKFGGPVVINGLSRFSQKHIQRPGLLLLTHGSLAVNGMVFVGFSKLDGTPGTATGYVYGYYAQDLQRKPLFLSLAPHGYGAGIWHSGAGLAAGVDSKGGQTYLFLATADGTFDANQPSAPNDDYGDTFLKLPTSLIPIAPASSTTYFTPFNQSCMLANDMDFGAGGVMLIPDGTVATHPYLAIDGGKDGNIYVMDRGTPGGYTGISNTNLQTIPDSGTDSLCKTPTQYYSSPAYWNHYIYFTELKGNITRYRLLGSCSPGPICTDSPSIVSSAEINLGASPSVSASGLTSGIVWTIANTLQLTGPYAILRAYDAVNLDATNHLKLLWNSAQCPTTHRDRPGYATKFTTPTIANGRVYIGTQDPSDPTNTRGELDMYGLNPFGACN